MTKEVLISLKGLQSSMGSGEEQVEVIVAGEYYFRNNKHYLLYEEVMEGSDEKTKTIVKAAPDYMELTRKGAVSTHMVFEKDKKNTTYYYTPYGSILMGIEAQDVNVSVEEEAITIDVKYVLDMNYEKVADCRIQMYVRPKDGGGFSLLR